MTNIALIFKKLFKCVSSSYAFCNDYDCCCNQHKIFALRCSDIEWGFLMAVFLQKKSESKQLMETKRHREERKKVRRSATKLSTKKTPKFWMGRKVRWWMWQQAIVQMITRNCTKAAALSFWSQNGFCVEQQNSWKNWYWFGRCETSLKECRGCGRSGLADQSVSQEFLKWLK